MRYQLGSLLVLAVAWHDGVFAQPFFTEERVLRVQTETGQSFLQGLFLLSGNRIYTNALLPESPTGFESSLGLVLDKDTAEIFSELRPDGFDLPFSRPVSSIAIGAETLVLGAPNALGIGLSYTFDLETLEYRGLLLPRSVVAGDGFGKASAIVADNILSSAPGVAEHAGRVFVFDPVTDREIGTIEPVSARPFDRFGESIVSDGEWVAITSRFAPDGRATGAVHLYQAETLAYQRTVLPVDAEVGSEVGQHGLAIHDGTVFVTTDYQQFSRESGRVTVIDAQNGLEIASLRPTDGSAYGAFGRQIAVSDDFIAVSSIGNDNYPDTFWSWIYLFDRQTFEQIARYGESEPQFSSLVGSIAIDNREIFVQRREFGQGDVGSIYVFQAPQQCPADVNRDGLLTGADFGAWLAAFNAGDLAADQNRDGLVNGNDFGAWLGNFNAGCE